MYFVYVLYSERLKKYYTGSTQDMEMRLLQHNSGKNTFTRNGMPWILIYSVQLESRSVAMKLENQIKKQETGRYLEDLGIET